MKRAMLIILCIMPCPLYIYADFIISISMIIHIYSISINTSISMIVEDCLLSLMLFPSFFLFSL